MIFSAARFSSVRFGAPAVSYAVPSAFSGLLANQDAPRSYLLYAEPYDSGSPGVVPVRFSSGLVNTVLGSEAWPARIGKVLNSEVTLFSESQADGGSYSFGQIELLIGDALHDDMLLYEWDGRQVTILMGSPGFDLSQYEPVFTGTAEDITYNQSRMQIIIRDKGQLLRKAVQTNLYAGTGGLEGGDDIAGNSKPLAYGYVENVTPVLVDRVNGIYQWHDGSVDSVIAVYDGADELTAAGDVADITATTVSAGQYKTQLSGGYIRIGAQPAKTLTLDGTGDDSGTGYVSTSADVARRLLEGHSDLTTADLNLSSFASLNVANSADIGLYITDGDVATHLTDILRSVGAAWSINRLGELVVAVFDFSTPVGTIDRNDILSIQKERTPVPTWRRRLGYARSWTVQDQNDVLPAADDARKDFVSQLSRYSVNEDTAIQTRRKLTDSVSVETLLAVQSDADTECARQQGVFGADRRIFRVNTKRQQFKYRPGQTITLKWPRFDLDAGVPAIIMGIVENTDARTTEMRLFV